VHTHTEVLGVIGNSPADLETVDGIGPKRRERIARAWQEGMQIREIMLFLHSHGVSTGRAVRIYKTYGEQAIEKVRENPYTLAKDTHGIGFATADQIAQSVGIPRDSQNRAKAGIDHVLLEATSEGHCALPLEKLKLAAVKLLEAPGETIEQALSQVLTSGSLLLEEIDGEPLIFLPHLRRAEEGSPAQPDLYGNHPRQAVARSGRTEKSFEYRGKERTVAQTLLGTREQLEQLHPSESYDTAVNA